MAIRANSYGSVSEVAALTRRYTDDGDYQIYTCPTLVEVEGFINRVSSIVNVLLAEAGFVIPVSQADAKLAIDEFVIAQVVQLCHGANGAGPFAPGSEELRNSNSTPFGVITKEAASFISDHAAGIEALGATRSTASIAVGLACRTTDDSGEDIVPPFQRKQFKTFNIDWDV